MKSIVIICLLFLSLFSMAQTIKKVTAKEIHSELEKFNIKNSVIIDARDSAMFCSGHINNAVNIDAFKSGFENELNLYLKKKTITIYCTKNKRSEILIDALIKLGYKGTIINITDGINGWKECKFNVICCSSSQ